MHKTVHIMHDRKNKKVLSGRQLTSRYTMMKQPGVWLAAVSALIFILIAPLVQPPWFLSIMVIVVSILLYSFE
jgi:4-hydroxybenzoate polyprenyltransferase